MNEVVENAGLQLGKFQESYRTGSGQRVGLYLYVEVHSPSNFRLPVRAIEEKSNCQPGRCF